MWDAGRKLEKKNGYSLNLKQPHLVSVRQSLNQSSSLFGTPDCYIHIFLFELDTSNIIFSEKKTTINTAIIITLLETTMNKTKKIAYDCGRYHLLCELLVNKWRSGSNILHQG